jgi:hypothetical protein
MHSPTSKFHTYRHCLRPFRHIIWFKFLLYTSFLAFWRIYGTTLHLPTCFIKPHFCLQTLTQMEAESQERKEPCIWQTDIVRLVLVLCPVHCLMAPSTELRMRTYEVPVHPNQESKLPNLDSHQMYAAYSLHPTLRIVCTACPTMVPATRHPLKPHKADNNYMKLSRIAQSSNWATEPMVTVIIDMLSCIRNGSTFIQVQVHLMLCSYRISLTSVHLEASRVQGAFNRFTTEITG